MLLKVAPCTVCDRLIHFVFATCHEFLVPPHLIPKLGLELGRNGLGNIRGELFEIKKIVVTALAQLATTISLIVGDNLAAIDIGELTLL